MLTTWSQIRIGDVVEIDGEHVTVTGIEHKQGTTFVSFDSRLGPGRVDRVSANIAQIVDLYARRAALKAAGTTEAASS